jgi:RNA polymerase sigma-70 factor (ECF subfamily)
MPRESTSLPSDEELARRARDGCAASFEQLVRQFQVPLLHFLRRQGAGGDAEDLLQETFLRAYANLHRYRPRWRLATWLFTIARRVAINHHRRSRPAVVEASWESAASDLPEPHQVLVEEETRQRLWHLAAQVLSGDEWTALWLFYVEQMPAREIAAVLGRSWVGVKTMLFRSRKRLLPLVLDLESDGSRQGDRSRGDCANFRGATSVARERAVLAAKTGLPPSEALGIEVPHG